MKPYVLIITLLLNINIYNKYNYLLLSHVENSTFGMWLFHLCHSFMQNCSSFVYMVTMSAQQFLNPTKNSALAWGQDSDLATLKTCCLDTISVYLWHYVRACFLLESKTAEPQLSCSLQQITFIFSSTFTRLPGPAAETHPHPPPGFTMGMMCFWCAFSKQGLLQCKKSLFKVALSKKKY